MSDSKLIRMANDIASFFQSYPHDEAVAGIHDHIQSYWTPKMRGSLRDTATRGDPGLHPLVAEAMTRSTQAQSPVDKEAAGPERVGQIGASDAG